MKVQDDYSQEVFRGTPRCMTRYKHKMYVMDKTSYLQKGWPVPIKSQDAVDNKMLR